MLLAVEPNPEPIAALVEELEFVELVAEGLADVMRSENRLVDPRAAPKLVADVPEVDEALVAVFVDATVEVEALIEVEPADTLEALELEFLDEARFPLILPRLPRNCGASSAAKRSAWIEPVKRTVRFSSPAEMTAVRKAAVDGPPPPFSAGVRL